MLLPKLKSLSFFLAKTKLNQNNCDVRKLNNLVLDFKNVCFRGINSKSTQSLSSTPEFGLDAKHRLKNMKKMKTVENDETSECQNNRCGSLNQNEIEKKRFWKISRQAYDQVPFIADCLKIEESKIFGRFIVTKEKLHPGEVIAIEEPLMTFVDASDICSLESQNQEPKTGKSTRFRKDFDEQFSTKTSVTPSNRHFILNQNFN
jgi:hypothetical protein